MELIIKVTGLCNFSCNFCSAGKTPIANVKYDRVDEKIVDLIRFLKPSSIICVGGDPLMVEPSYYYELHDIARCNIGITSNLKSFYLNPDKWVDLLKMPWIGTTTSFQYGEGRKWDSNTIYDEKMFVNVYEKYMKLVDKPLPFIAVIDYDNEDTVLRLCKLAKSLNTKVKINNMLAKGLQNHTYPRYKIFNKYLEIIDAGYGEYESYCSNEYATVQCPINSEFVCESCIRSCYVDRNNKLIYYKCDHIEEEKIDDYMTDDITYRQTIPDLSQHVTEYCWMCDLFELCNGCRCQKMLYPPEHCSEMKKILPRLIEIGWIKPKGLM